MSVPPPPPQRALSAKRKSIVKPLDMHAIPMPSSRAEAMPVEHVGSPTSSVDSGGGRASFQSRSRTLSTLTSDTSSSTAPAVRTNRFSTSFPVQPSNASSPTRVSQSPTRDAAAVVPETLASPTGPTDTSFLTAIATQERRVLELREHLHVAETDLNKLKRQWAQHEASKKRNDARRVQRLEPVHSSLLSAAGEGGRVGEDDDVDGSSAWMQAEMERRKALLNGGRSSSRTVFSGSRHTRTLSLLSPARDEASNGNARPTPTRQALPPRKESLVNGAAVHRLSEASARPPLMTRASATLDLTTEVASADSDMNLPDNMDKAALDHEVLLRQGKKMATDFRDGLWTFFEDLRQVAVGEDATLDDGRRQRILPNTGDGRPGPRRIGSKDTVRSARSAGLKPTPDRTRGAKTPSPARKQNAKRASAILPDLANPTFWTEHGVSVQPAATTPVKKSPSARGHAKAALSRHEKKGSISAPSTASTDGGSSSWEAWGDDQLSSPHTTNIVSRSSSTASEGSGVSGADTTQPSTVSASPRPSSEMIPGAGKSPKSPISGSGAELPWPALLKAGPSSLRRTASHLMSEWEKSLTPAPGQEYGGEEEYAGLGMAGGAAAEAQAVSVSAGGGGGGRKRD